MSLVIDIGNNRKIYLPKGYQNQDHFIGLWLQAQEKAITKVKDEFIFKTYSDTEFDDRVDVVTYEIIGRLNMEAKYVYRRKFKT